MLINHNFKCAFCNSDNKITISEDDRGTLQMKRGDEIPYSCSNCHKKDKIHINKIKAEPNSNTFIFSCTISIIISIILILFFGLIATLSFGVPMIIYLYQQNIAKSFNSYKVRTK